MAWWTSGLEMTGNASRLTTCPSLTFASVHTNTWQLQIAVQVKLTELAGPGDILMMVAGSVCKDWSSMGKSQQWLGQYAILCAIFIALTRHLQCSLVIHECTARFDYKLLQDLMPGHQDFHTVLSPTNFGCPVSRTRSYDVLLLKGKLKLPKGLRELHKLCVPCTLDAGVWLEAPDDMVAWSRYTM